MTIVAVSVHKETKEVKAGIKFRQDGKHNEPVSVLEIVPGSLFANTAPQIQPGMFVVSINNVSCIGMTTSEVAQLIKAAVGTVIVLLETNMMRARGSLRCTVIATSIHKKTKDVKAGIRFKQETYGAVRVRDIIPDSLFATNAPELQPEMRILSINNVQCTIGKVSQVAALIKEAEGTITILAHEELSRTAEHIMIQKETQNVDTGLVVTSHIHVQELAPDSLFKSAPQIRQGTRILSINNVKCDGKSQLEVSQLINNAEGPLNILVDNDPVESKIMAHRDLSKVQHPVDPEAIDALREIIMCCCCPESSVE